MKKKIWEKPEFELLTFHETAGSGKANVPDPEDFVRSDPNDPTSPVIPNSGPDSEGPS